MANKITVEFSSRGGDQLKKKIDDLYVSQVRLQKGQKAATKALNKLNNETVRQVRVGALSTKTLRTQTGAFATMRSQLLLASFAFGLVNASVLKLGRAFGEQEQAENRLEGLIGKSVDSLKAKASALQQVTRFGDEETLAAMTLVAAYTDNESAIAQVTEAAMDLATVKGMSLNTATDMLSKSIFSSTNSMQRYGVSIEGVAGSGARLNSALSTISGQMGGAAKKDADTFLGAMDQMNMAVGDLGEDFGELLAPAIVATADAIKEIAEIIDVNSEQFKAYGTSVLIVGSGFALYTGYVKAAANATLLFGKALNVTKIGLLITAIGMTLDQFDFFSDESEETANSLKDLNDQLDGNAQLLKNATTAERELFDIKHKNNVAKEKDLMLDVQLEELKKNGLNMDMQGLQLKHRLILADMELQRLSDLKNKGLLTEKEREEFKGLQLNANIARNKIIIEQEQRIINLEQKRKDMQLGLASGFLKVSKAMTSDAEKQKNITFLLAMIDAYKIYLSTLRNLLQEGMDSKEAKSYATAEFAQATLMATAIRAQKFEYGGLVGGRRHSQGGTLIEAERGEFVMSRNAVQSIGVDNLEAMNQGGSAVNITITGNVMTSDFVEGELAEKIRDAVRTGTDFGMS